MDSRCEIGGDHGSESNGTGVSDPGYNDQPLELTLQRISDGLQGVTIGMSEIGNDGGDSVENFRFSNEFLRAIQ